MVTTLTAYFLEGIVTKPFFLPSKEYMSAGDDQFYIAKILDGDTKAFAILVNRYKNLIFNLAFQMLQNREEAEEVSQDTFIKIFNSLKKFRGDSKFSTWAYKIAYNSCLDRLKANKRQQPTVAIDEFTERHVRTMETAFDAMERSDKERCIKECLRRLSADDGTLIILFYYDELSLTEISKIVGVTTNNVKIKLFRARKRLATILRQQLEPAILENYGQGDK